MLFTFSAILIFGIQDAISKSLVQTHSPFQIAMMRFWAFALFSLYLVSRQAPLRQAFRSRYPVLQVLRAALLVIDAEEGVRESRVRLCGITASVLKTGLGLLGLIRRRRR